MNSKECTKCLKEVPLSQYKKRKDTSHGFRRECNACLEAYRKIRLSEPTKREKERQRLREMRANQTPEQRRTYNDKCLAYYSRNKSEFNRRVRQRQAQLKQAIPKWANTEWEKFLMQEIYHLSSLRQEVLGVEMHVDHIVPLTSDLVCGLHWSGNIQIVSAEYNRSKSNLIWEYMP